VRVSAVRGAEALLRLLATPATRLWRRDPRASPGLGGAHPNASEAMTGVSPGWAVPSHGGGRHPPARVKSMSPRRERPPRYPDGLRHPVQHELAASAAERRCRRRQTGKGRRGVALHAPRRPSSPGRLIGRLLAGRRSRLCHTPKAAPFRMSIGNFSMNQPGSTYERRRPTAIKRWPEGLLLGPFTGSDELSVVTGSGPDWCHRRSSSTRSLRPRGRCRSLSAGRRSTKRELHRGLANSSEGFAGSRRRS